MVNQLWSEIMTFWNWLLSQLGWSGSSLGWLKITVLVLALFGALFVLRRLLGGSSVGGGGGSTVVYPSERQRGFPTSFYVGNRRLSDFSVPKDVYDFRVPVSTPNLSNLRKSVPLNLEKAKKLFIPPSPSKPRGGREAAFSREGDSVESSGSNQDNKEPKVPSPGVKLDWDLAGKLFIPNFPGKNGKLRRR